MNKGTIYLSSTDYDLLDARRELAAFLRDLGYAVLAFEEDDFPGTGEIGRHDRCVRAVEDADYFFVLVDRRAGAPYKGSKFYPTLKDKITITHAEAKRAVELGKPIAMFVRKETWDFRETYNTSLRSQPHRAGSRKRDREPESGRVQKKDARRIVQLLDFLQHDQKPWLYVFRDVTDLKDRIGKHLDEHEIFGGCSYQLYTHYCGAFVQAKGIASIVRHLYRRHSGEIWLLNNDLELIKSSLFEDIYLKSFVPNKRITAVRLLLSDDKHREFTRKSSDNHRRLVHNLGQLGERLKDVYVGQLSDFRSLGATVVSPINIILYTSNNNPDDPDSVALLRPHFAPFCAHGANHLSSEDLLIACRQPHIPELFARMNGHLKIQQIFQKHSKFKRLELSSDKKSLILR